MNIEITKVTFSTKPIARLRQDFSGAYHVEFGGKTVAFSLSLTQAQDMAKREGWELR